MSPCPENVFSAYLRVSTQEQADSRAGLDDQELKINLYAQLHNLEIRHWRVDPGFGAGDLNRPGMQEALEDVRSGRTNGIIIAKLDRLSRSVFDYAALMQDALRYGWNLISVDLGLDLKSPHGRLISDIMMAVAAWERTIIGERTKDGLAAKRAQGVRLGRPREATDELLDTVVNMWLEFGNYSEISRRLNDAGVETVQRGRLWYPATVRSMVLSQDGRALMASLDEEAA